MYQLNATFIEFQQSLLAMPSVVQIVITILFIHFGFIQVAWVVWYFRNRVHGDKHVRMAVAAIDGYQHSALHGAQQRLIAGKLATMAKIRFHLPVRNEANFLIVREYIRREMEKLRENDGELKDMRVKDARVIHAHATEMAFLRDDVDRGLDAFFSSLELENHQEGTFVYEETFDRLFGIRKKRAGLRALRGM
jgi:hypothetical protein